MSFLKVDTSAPHPFMLIQLGNPRPVWANLTCGACLEKAFNESSNSIGKEQTLLLKCQIFHSTCFVWLDLFPWEIIQSKYSPLPGQTVKRSATH